MKRSCSSLTGLLEKYHDQEATDGERTIVEDHLKECSFCQETLRSWETLRESLKAPVDAAAGQEDFPWLWQKIQRGIKAQERPTWRESVRSWLDWSSVLPKKAWVPALVATALLVWVLTPIVIKKDSSQPDGIVVQYVESATSNVMVYDLEQAKITLIWVFEDTENDTTTS